MLFKSAVVMGGVHVAPGYKSMRGHTIVTYPILDII